MSWLILVDNGSEDRTLQIMECIKERSPSASVIVVHEPDRGYVPARYCGVLAARALAHRLGIPEQHFLILQADADTCCARDYVAAMRAMASSDGGYFLQGTSSTPDNFSKLHSGYYRLTQQVDAPLERLYRRLETRWRKPVKPGDAIKPTGIVKAKQVTDKSRRVLIDVVVTNQSGEKVAIGEAMIEFPKPQL